MTKKHKPARRPNPPQVVNVIEIRRTDIITGSFVNVKSKAISATWSGIGTRKFVNLANLVVTILF